jgi:hypothetical protein
VLCHRPDLDCGDTNRGETRTDGCTRPGGFHYAGLAS